MLPFFIPCFFHHSTNRHKFADERSMKFIFCYVYYFISKENLYYGNNQSKEEINHAETLSKNVPDGEDADTILADLCEETSMEEPGLAYDVFNTWKAAQTSHERESIEGMFLIFAGIEFGEYLERCIKETTQEGEQ